MIDFIKILIVLGLVYCLIHWAVSNPETASTIVDRVGSIITSGTDFISENLFDKEGV